MRALAEMAGAPFEDADFPVPDGIAAGCPGAQGFTTPWGPVIVCGDDQLWFQNDAGEWVDSKGRDVPEHFRSSLELDTEPTPPPDPPPEPSAMSPLWIAVGVGGLALLGLLAGWLILRDDPKEPDGPSVVLAGPTSTAGPGTTVAGSDPPPSDDPDGGEDTDPDDTAVVVTEDATPGVEVTAPVAEGDDLPADAVTDAEVALGLPPGSLDGLVLEHADLLWESAGTRPEDDGPAITSYGAMRVGDVDVFVFMFDRPITDAGGEPTVEGAGTQIGVGRAPAPIDPGGLAGFGAGYTLRAFADPGGDEVTVIGDGGEVLTAIRAQAYIDSMLGFMTLPSDDTIARMSNFYREPTGSEPTADDPTAYQVTPAFQVTGDGMEPAS